MAPVWDDIQGTSMKPFLASFKSEQTKVNYCIKLRHLLSFAKIDVDAFVELAREHPKKAESLIFDYIESRKKEGVGPSTMLMARDAMKLLLEMNDVETINWKKIRRVIPSAKRHGNDRVPETEEIKRLLLHADLRLKCVILILVSSGMRIGAFDYLTWGDVEPIKANNVDFAKARVYAGEPEEYYGFITPEAWEALMEYRKVREDSGEKIEAKSPLIISTFNKKDFSSSSVGPASSKYLRNRIGELWNESSMRKKDSKNTKAHEFKQVHGFRKFFKSVAERAVKSIYVEMMMGYATGLNASYMKPCLEELAEEYTKAIPSLTILSSNNGGMSEDKIIEAFNRRFLAMGEITEEEMAKLGDISKITPQQLYDIIENKRKSKVEGEGAQMVVSAGELNALLKKGWKYHDKLSRNEIIIDPPAA